MTKEEALSVLVKNGWSVKDAETDIKEWLDDEIIPLEEQVKLALEIRKAMTPEREYVKNEEGHIVDEP